jgi:hypothetical protein
MINPIPSNVIVWLIGALILVPLGVRAWLHSRQVKTPTAKYFAATGLLGGIGLACYSLPSVFTNNPHWLKAGVLLGIPFIYAMLAIQPYYLWYSVFQSRFRLSWLLVPFGSLAFVTAVYELSYTLTDNIYISNNELVYGFNVFSRYAQSLLLLLIVINGGIFIKQAMNLKHWSLIRFLSLGLLFIVVGISTIIDNIFYTGQNASPTLLYAYLLSAVFLP